MQPAVGNPPRDLLAAGYIMEIIQLSFIIA